MRSGFNKHIHSFNKYSTTQHSVCCSGRGDYCGKISVGKTRVQSKIRGYGGIFLYVLLELDNGTDNEENKMKRAQ
jgi:hypothetical protein